MCDIYTDLCRGCDRRISMHLGEYETSREEIIVLCETCFENNQDVGSVKGAVKWKVGERERDDSFKVGEFFIIYALTDNAWSNRDMNHPNVGNPIKVMDIVVEKK